MFRLKNVLITEEVDSCCEKLLVQHGVSVTKKVGLPKEQLIKEIETYDGLIVRSATKVTSEIINAGKQLCIIGRAGTGVDNIDAQAATRQGVLVINAPGGNTLSAAELTCGMIVTLSRSIPLACSSLKSGKWDRKKFMGNELGGKTLAIIGLGRIGREVASRMQAFGMTTIGFDPLVPAEASKEFGVESFVLDEIWPKADYITVHVPLIKQTKNLINDKVFALCKKGVRVVNCARGGIIEEEALLRALESGQCAGAGLDVYTQEPPPADSALLQHPNVICTPHLGANTHEAQKKVAEEIAEQFVDLLNNKAVFGIVNSPAFCQSLASDNRGWVSLCQSLGSLLGTMMRNAVSDSTPVSIELSGKEVPRISKVLEIAVTMGFLRQTKCSDANFVNADLLAKEANITVSSSESKASTITVIGKVGSQLHSLTGTVQGDKSHLLSIDGCNFGSPSNIMNNMIVCRGERQKMTSKLLDFLSKMAAVHSIHWSNTVENKMWCVINSDFKAQAVPDKLKDVVDFWAQIGN